MADAVMGLETGKGGGKQHEIFLSVFVWPSFSFLWGGGRGWP